MTTCSNRFVFKFMKSFLILIPFICATGLCAATQPQVEQNPPPLDPKNMDTSVKPGDDFYLFANGGWIKSNPVPPEFSRWAAFNELAEKNIDAEHETTEKAAGGGNAPKDPKKPAKNDKATSVDVQKV